MTVFASGTRVVVTGATSGLGREMARQLGSRGCRVAITGRRGDRLVTAAAQASDAGAMEVLTLQGSVTDPDTVRDHYQQIKSAWGGLDVAILNAGVGDGDESAFNTDTYRWHFETNFFGVCNWIEAALPDMLGARSGIIAGISSPAAWRGFPSTGPYSASKAALSTMLESVRVDLRHSGVKILTICPGFVKSEMTDRNDPRDMMFVLKTHDGVRRLLRGIEKQHRVVHFPKPFTSILRYVVGSLPGFIYDPLASRFIHRRKAPYIDQSQTHPPSDPE